MPLQSSPPQPPLQQFKLANGLQVFLREDRRAPLASVQLWYHVGSSHEPVGSTGLSHALEHLLLDGSSKLPQREYLTAMRDLGAAPNARTSQEATYFPLTLPVNRLEVALEALADTTARPTLDPDDFSKVIKIVKAEHRSQIGAHSVTRALELHSSFAYGNSSYSTPVLGLAQDVDALTISAARAWHQGWYHPDNATLVVVGAIDLAKLKIWVERHFGRLASGTVTQPAPPARSGARAYRSQSLHLGGLKKGVLLSFDVPSHATAATTEQAYALRLLPELLGSGEHSLLRRRLMTEQSVLQGLRVEYEPFKRGESSLGIFTFTDPAAGSPEQAQEKVLNEIRSLAQQSLDTGVLERAKAKLLADLTYARDDISHQATLIGQCAACGLDPALLDNERQAIESVTTEHITQVVTDYLTRDRLSATFLYPPGLISLEGLDRDKLDPLTSNVQSWRTENGTRVKLVERRELPVVDLALRFDAGTSLDRQHSGLAALTLHMLGTGSNGSSAAAHAAKFQELGAIISSEVQLEHSTVKLRSSSARHLLVPAVALLNERVAKPDFPSAALPDIKKKLASHTHLRQSYAFVRAGTAVYHHLYPDHPYAAVLHSTQVGLDALTIEQVKAFHGRAYAATNLEMTFVGDLSRADATLLAESISQALPQGWTATKAPPPPSPRPATLHLEDDSPSTAATLALPISLPADSPHYIALELACEILGNSADSRLMRELRTRLDLVYSISAQLKRHSACGLIAIQWNIASQHLEASLERVQAVLAGFLDTGPTEEELRRARQSLGVRLMVKAAQNGKLLDLIADQGTLNLPDDHLDTCMDRLSEQSPDSIRQVLREQLDMGLQVVVNVGKTTPQVPLPTPPSDQ